MPEAAKPAPAPHGFVHSAGKQEDFAAAAVELADKLGWKGQPEWVTNDIAVSDAQGFLCKSLHEFFIAGAKGEEQPLPDLVCEHLAIVDAGEWTLLRDALLGAFTAGKGVEVTSHKASIGQLGAPAGTV